MEISQASLAIITTFLLGLITPGPDFALVIRNSLVKTKKQGLLTALGISCGLFIHLSLCIFGLKLIVDKSPSIFLLIKDIGGTYLLYLCLQSLFMAIKPNEDNSAREDIGFKIFMNNSFLQGFLCHILNISSLLYLLFLFATIENVSIEVKLVYGFIMWLSAMLWFCGLTFLVSIPKFKQKLNQFKPYLHLTFAISIGTLGILILISR